MLVGDVYDPSDAPSNLITEIEHGVSSLLHMYSMAPQAPISSHLDVSTPHHRLGGMKHKDSRAMYNTGYDEVIYLMQLNYNNHSLHLDQLGTYF